LDKKYFGGLEYGGWTLYPGLLSSDSVIYSAGVGTDITFDRALIKECGAVIHGFDPTPRCLLWINAQTLPDHYVFHAYGLADFDGEANFVPPPVKEHVSYSMNTAQTKNSVSCQVHQLSTIMKMLGHSKIDVLKMDIERAEYAVIENIIETDIRPRQILVEFHHHLPTVAIKQTQAAIRLLNEHDWRLYHRSANGYECSFLDVHSG